MRPTSRYRFDPELERFVDAETGATVVWFTPELTVNGAELRASFDIQLSMARFIIVESRTRELLAAGLIAVEYFSFDSQPDSQATLGPMRWFYLGQIYAQWRHVRDELAALREEASS